MISVTLAAGSNGEPIEASLQVENVSSATSTSVATATSIGATGSATIPSENSMFNLPPLEPPNDPVSSVATCSINPSTIVSYQTIKPSTPIDVVASSATLPVIAGPSHDIRLAVSVQSNVVKTQDSSFSSAASTGNYSLPDFVSTQSLLLSSSSPIASFSPSLQTAPPKTGVVYSEVYGKCVESPQQQKGNSPLSDQLPFPPSPGDHTSSYSLEHKRQVTLPPALNMGLGVTFASSTISNNPKPISSSVAIASSNGCTNYNVVSSKQFSAPIRGLEFQNNFSSAPSNSSCSDLDISSLLHSSSSCDLARRPVSAFSDPILVRPDVSLQNRHVRPSVSIPVNSNPPRAFMTHLPTVAGPTGSVRMDVNSSPVPRNYMVSRAPVRSTPVETPLLGNVRTARTNPNLSSTPPPCVQLPQTGVQSQIPLVNNVPAVSSSGLYFSKYMVLPKTYKYK